MQATPAFPDVDAVVIGTSAGGVDALLCLLPALPATFRRAVLVRYPHAGTWTVALVRTGKFCRWLGPTSGS